jgi:hypothetical protein
MLIEAEHRCGPLLPRDNVGKPARLRSHQIIRIKSFTRRSGVALPGAVVPNRQESQTRAGEFSNL